MQGFARPAAALLTLLALFAASALPALAQEEEGSEEPVQVVESDLEPAVPIPEEPASESLPDWTYRYMIPTTLLLAAVVILLTSIRYFTDVVRRRYRVIEE